MARRLTLHEKISMKGEIFKKLGPCSTITKITDTREMLHYWYMCFDISIVKYFKGRNGYRIAMEMAKERRKRVNEGPNVDMPHL